tara:strand:+ start:637 stop:1116 length:480 start_codon:yes stop_codon:yes gene_type:complete
MNAFVQYVLKKTKEKENDYDVFLFKIIMEIHSCHEKLKSGYLHDDEGCRKLISYYHSVAGEHTRINQQIDTVFFDCRDVPRVYSIEFDDTFPLAAYPYYLYKKNRPNAFPRNESENKIFDFCDKRSNVKNVNEFIQICRLLDRLSKETKINLSIHNFLL